MCTTVPLPKLKAAAHRGGGALNDAFVAGIAGGLRRHHEKHGVRIGDLHLTMPISVRTDDDDEGGNHITLARFDVPVGEADPAARIAETRARTTKVRNEKSTPYIQIIAGAMNLMPRWYIGPVLRKVDFLASDVPGCRCRCTWPEPRCGFSTHSVPPSARRSTSPC